MKIDCNVIRDLLPLYAEDLVSEETAALVREHLQDCPACQAELDALTSGESLAAVEAKPTSHHAEEAKPFKRVMKRMNRQFYTLAYSLVIFFIFLGFGWTGGENLMYNSLLMPIVGVFGYYVFRLRAVYKMPILLLVIDLFVCVSGLLQIDLYSALIWTAIYSLFVLVGIAIAFLLHFTFRKEEKK